MLTSSRCGPSTPSHLYFLPSPPEFSTLNSDVIILLYLLLLHQFSILKQYSLAFSISKWNHISCITFHLFFFRYNLRFVNVDDVAVAHLFFTTDTVVRAMSIPRFIHSLANPYLCCCFFFSVCVHFFTPTKITTMNIFIHFYTRRTKVEKLL